MLEVLYFSDRQVKQKLFDRVDASSRPLLVVQVRQEPVAGPPGEREPFASLERRLGDVVDQVVVADEGSKEGMWRDPLGDLSDRLFPQDRHAAYAAATGYLLLQLGRPLAVVKKRRSAAEDLWFLQQALATHLPGVPPPDPARRPGPRPKAPPHRPRAPGPAPSPPPPAPPSPTGDNPWAMLGIAKGTPLPEAKRAFRALVAQYHPDKVAHLGPEFQELADRRTREILEAWCRIEEGEGLL